MILSRVIAHFRKQEWTAIFIDFVIVVLGVFVGLQVSNWNAARLAAADERALLARLQDESERAVSYWRYEVDVSQRANENRRVLLAELNAGIATPERRQAIDDAFKRLGHYGALNPPRAVLDELIDAGGLSRISNLDVRRAVADYHAQLNYIYDQLDYFRAALPQIALAYRGSIFSEYAPESPSLRRFAYDIPSLARNRQFASDIIDFVRDQLQFNTYRESVLTKALAMCEAVSQAIDAECKSEPFSNEEALRREGVN